MSWEKVKGERDKLFQVVFEGLSAEERDILLELLRLEAEQRGTSAPRIKTPLRAFVEGKIL